MAFTKERQETLAKFLPVSGWMTPDQKTWLNYKLDEIASAQNLKDVRQIQKTMSDYFRKEVYIPKWNKQGDNEEYKASVDRDAKGALSFEKYEDIKDKSLREIEQSPLVVEYAGESNVSDKNEKATDDIRTWVTPKSSNGEGLAYNPNHPKEELTPRFVENPNAKKKASANLVALNDAYKANPNDGTNPLKNIAEKLGYDAETFSKLIDVKYATQKQAQKEVADDVAANQVISDRKNLADEANSGFWGFSGAVMTPTTQEAISDAIQNGTDYSKSDAAKDLGIDFAFNTLSSAVGVPIGRAIGRGVTKAVPVTKLVGTTGLKNAATRAIHTLPVGGVGTNIVEGAAQGGLEAGREMIADGDYDLERVRNTGIAAATIPAALNGLLGVANNIGATKGASEKIVSALRGNDVDLLKNEQISFYKNLDDLLKKPGRAYVGDAEKGLGKHTLAELDGKTDKARQQLASVVNFRSDFTGKKAGKADYGSPKDMMNTVWLRDKSGYANAMRNKKDPTYDTQAMIERLGRMDGVINGNNYKPVFNKRSKTFDAAIAPVSFDEWYKMDKKAQFGKTFNEREAADNQMVNFKESFPEAHRINLKLASEGKQPGYKPGLADALNLSSWEGLIPLATDLLTHGDAKAARTGHSITLQMADANSERKPNAKKLLSLYNEAKKGGNIFLADIYKKQLEELAKK